MNNERLVTGAIIIENGKVLIARRAPSEPLALSWEFPGGKVEKGETFEQCLTREIKEELGVDISVGDFFCESVFEYPKGVIKLQTYISEITGGDIELTVHDKLAWATKDELLEFDLLPADVPIAQRIIKELL